MEDLINIKDFILNKYTEIKVPEKTLDVVFDNEIQVLGNEHGQQKCKDLMYPFARTPLFKVDIIDSRILLDAKDYPIHSKDIWEIALSAKNLKDYEWLPGDTIAILPHNKDQTVVEVLQLLSLEDVADTRCSIEISKTCKKKTAKVPAYIPSFTTPREILRDCVNLKSVLKKQFLRALAEHCVDNDEKDFLKSLSSKEGSVLYNDLIMLKGISLLDILKLCSTCKPPFSLVVENLTRLLPRPYSIANSMLKSNDEIRFIFTVLNNKPGVVTHMLAEKCRKGSETILMYLREPNYFRYGAEDFEKNQILIAIGSGLAPFLGFLQQKEYMMMNEENIKKSGITWLLVGAASEQAVIHRQQLMQWQSQNVIVKFVEAHSRVTNARYHYVQDSLEDNSQEVVELLMKPETVLYVCADGGEISNSLEKSLQSILSKELSINEEETIEMIKELRATKRYREDIWT